MRFSGSDFTFYLLLCMQAVIAVLLIRFISLWLGYDAYVPYVDDLYGWLLDLLIALARRAPGLLPRIW